MNCHVAAACLNQNLLSGVGRFPGSASLHVLNHLHPFSGEIKAHDKARRRQNSGRFETAMLFAVGTIAPFGATALLAAGAQAQTPTAVAATPMVLRVNGHGHNDCKPELARRTLVRALILVRDMPVAGAS